MSEVNLAYQVLRRPDSRRDYDRSLRAAEREPVDGAGSGGAADQPRRETDHGSEWEGDPATSPGARLVGRVLTPPGPAKMPWKLMGAMAVIGTAAVVATAALADPPQTEPPDGILQVGSCVTIESNGDAREVACADSSALVVRRLLPTGSTCPPAYATHRDRLGLGTVCVEDTG